MPRCKQCDKPIPATITINGKLRNLCSRKFCLECSPFGSHNTRDLTKPRALPRSQRPNRICALCKGQEPAVTFYQTSNSNYCKKCFTRWKHERDTRVKKKAIEYKGGKCQRCGFVGHYAVFDFHHLRDKEMNWRMMCNSGWERARPELDKCELLCSNCHRLEHSSHKL